MFSETNDLCRAYNLLRLEIKKLIPEDKEDVDHGIMIDMTNNLRQNCLENTYIIDEIADVFAMKNYERPEYLPRRISHNLYRTNKAITKEEIEAMKDGRIVRKARQVVVGIGIAAVAVITSLISIFSSKELVQMANQDTSDLIANNNHIIESIQEQETRLSRQEQMTKEMKKHLAGLEKELFVTLHYQKLIVHMLGIKTYATSVTRHLQRFQEGLYELLKNKVSPRLVPLHTIENSLERLQATLTKRRYSMAIENPSDIYQCESSFVGFENGRLVILIHLPIYKRQSLMKLFHYRPTPISTTNYTNEQIIITPEKPIIGINEDFTLFSTYTEADIHHDCKNLHNNYYCKNNNILRKTGNARETCLISLYTKSVIGIKTKCCLHHNLRLYISIVCKHELIS